VGPRKAEGKGRQPQQQQEGGGGGGGGGGKRQKQKHWKNDWSTDNRPQKGKQQQADGAAGAAAAAGAESGSDDDEGGDGAEGGGGRKGKKRKVALAIMYRGTSYCGLQLQNGEQARGLTVERVLLDAIHAAGGVSKENMNVVSKIKWSDKAGSFSHRHVP
jgi:hypothetical protein